MKILNFYSLALNERENERISIEKIFFLISSTLIFHCFISISIILHLIRNYSTFIGFLLFFIYFIEFILYFPNVNLISI